MTHDSTLLVDKEDEVATKDANTELKHVSLSSLVDLIRRSRVMHANTSAILRTSGMVLFLVLLLWVSSHSWDRMVDSSIWLYVAAPPFMVFLIGLAIYHSQSKQACKAVKDAFDTKLDLQREALRVTESRKMEQLDRRVFELQLRLDEMEKD